VIGFLLDFYWIFAGAVERSGLDMPAARFFAFEPCDGHSAVLCFCNARSSLPPIHFSRLEQNVSLR
jgi:hypothetical protein